MFSELSRVELEGVVDVVGFFFVGVFAEGVDGLAAVELAVAYVLSRIAGLDYEYNTVHIGRNNLRVSDRIDRRRVDNNVS